jgi:two-component sensor histidine kinase
MRSTVLTFFYLFLTGHLLYAAPIQDGRTLAELKIALQRARTDTARIKAWLALGSYHLYKPGEYAGDLDSAYTFFKQAGDLSDSLQLNEWRYRCLSLIGNCFFERRDTTQGKRYFMQIIQESTASGDKRTAAGAWRRMGNSIGLARVLYDTRIYCFEQAAQLYRQLHDRENEIAMLKEIADIHMNQRKAVLAEEELLNVLQMYRETGYVKLHYTYDLLSANSMLRGNLNKALYYAMEAVKSMERTTDSSDAGYFYEKIANVYRDMGKTSESIAWYRKAFDKFESSQNVVKRTFIFGLCGQIVRGLIKAGQVHEALSFLNRTIKKYPPTLTWEKEYITGVQGDCYNALKQYDLAEKYYLQMVQYEESDNEPVTNVDAYYVIGKFYIERQRYEKAGLYLNKALAASHETETGVSTLSNLMDIHLFLFKVDSAAGNYLSAIRHFREHKALSDNLFSNTKSRQIEELQIQYETAQKEHNIKLLQHERDTQQARLKQAGILRNVTLACIMLLLIIIILLYNRYRMKLRSHNDLQQLITVQKKLINEKEWLLKEIHHRVKNNLQIVMSLLGTQSAFLENEAALKANQESQHRIQTMALIHKKLYQSDNMSLINMQSYIQELVNYLRDSFDAWTRITFDISIAPVQLEVSQAVPVGLILNEAITNAIKYAFPGTGKGMVSIRMESKPDQHLLLTVSDNGVGLPESFNVDADGTFGISLMKTLSGQLGGSFSIRNRNSGVTITIAFSQPDDTQAGLTPEEEYQEEAY